MTISPGEAGSVQMWLEGSSECRGCPQTKGCGNFMSWEQGVHVRKGQEWKSTESKWRKESLTFSDNETANAGTWTRNADIHQSMAGGG